MKLQILSMFIGALALTIATTADAQVSVNFGINTCGYPTIFQTCTDYPPPPTVYLGSGRWGDDGGHGDRRGRREGGRNNGGRNDGGHNGGGRPNGGKHR
jgi:hypothetical protein